MKAKDYKTVCGENVSKFDEDVKKLLNEGWELFGNPYGTGEHSNQALIKPKKANPKDFQPKPEDAPMGQ